MEQPTHELHALLKRNPSEQVNELLLMHFTVEISIQSTHEWRISMDFPSLWPRVSQFTGTSHFHVASRRCRCSSGKPRCPVGLSQLEVSWDDSHGNIEKCYQKRSNHPISVPKSTKHGFFTNPSSIHPGFWGAGNSQGCPKVRLIVVVETPGATVAEPATIGESWTESWRVS